MMNYPNEEIGMNNNQINVNQNKITKYIKSLNYPQKNINIGKMTLKKQMIKQEKEKEKEKTNPEIIEFKLKEKNLYINKPKPNLELYQKKENQEQNNIFENNEIINNEYLMPKHSIKSSNSFKINTKIKNKKYLNKNKIYDFPNDFDYINSNENILSKNYSNKTNTKKISNFNLITPNNPNTSTNLKMTKSSIQINGIDLPQSNNINNNHLLSRITSIDLNLEGGSPQKKFLKKNSYNKFEINKYIPTTFNNSSKRVNINNKYKTNLPKKDFNANMNYNYKTDNVIKELKKNKINKNSNNELMGLDNYNKEINFVQTNNEYNNIFFYNSKTNSEINTENYQRNKNNNNINYYSAKEKIKNKFIYKKTKSINKKEEAKKSNKITLIKKRIKNNIENNHNIIDINIKLPQKIENISININKDNIKEKIEEIINKNELNYSYYEPIFSIVNNSINVLNNINKIKISKIKNINELNEEELNDNNLDYSRILDIIEKNKLVEFIEKIYPDYYNIEESKRILNMSI